MITRREMVQAMAAGSALLAGLVGAASATGAGSHTENPTEHDKGVKVTELIRHSLPEAPDHEAVLVMVEYAPGASSSAHRHPGSTFAYVLQGAIESQVDPGDAHVYTHGQTWYELPMHPHRISRNASAKRGAKLLAFLIMKKGEATVLPPA